jgi:hypothetical protein
MIERVKPEGPRQRTPRDTTNDRRRERDRAGSASSETAQPVSLTAYRVGTGPELHLAPAPREREWLDATQDRFGYRCLPVLIANQAGWFIHTTHALDAVWDGGNDVDAVEVTYHAGDPPYPAVSHFGYGILTWHIPFLFQTPPGIQLLARGPANWFKDGIHPLEGLIETDWTAATFTMNWKMVRPRLRVSFAPGDPICMIVPVALDLLERTVPEVQRIQANPALHAQFAAWSGARSTFAQGLVDPALAASAQGWQKDYFRGVSPDGTPAPSHRTKLRLNAFFDVDGTSDPDSGGVTPTIAEPRSRQP